MRFLQSVIVGLGLTLAVGGASAGVSQQEADQLGKSLTLWGANPEGNADKTIPPYTGGLPQSTAPAGWKKGSGRYDVGPFDNEKPLFSINAGNYEKYASHLTAGTIAMLKKYPEFRVDVYPTHRSMAHSEDWLSHCKTNALNAKITPSLNGVEDAHSCVPFPIPTNGAEVIWNAVLTDALGVRSVERASTWLVDGDGHLTDVGRVEAEWAQAYADPKTNTLKDGVWQYLRTTWMGPPSQVGMKLMTHYSLNYDKNDLRAWIYMPGQRRTRLAPELSYDTPIAADGGALNCDERFGFAGQLDRYDFKIVGKKEVYAMYNSNRVLFSPIEKIFAKRIANPDLTRWELHRVWVVEATLKPGKRHVEPRRTLYVDEDSWLILAADAYDQAKNLFKVSYDPVMPLWDIPTSAEGMIYYDLSKGTTYYQGFSDPGDMVQTRNEIGSLSVFTPAALTSSGIR